jgi:hypothetical protein
MRYENYDIPLDERINTGMGWNWDRICAEEDKKYRRRPCEWRNLSLRIRDRYAPRSIYGNFNIRRVMYLGRMLREIKEYFEHGDEIPI